MKKYILMLATVATMGLASCGDDYLETAPNDAVPVEDVYATTANINSAINGICKMMSNQYLGTQGMNGEGTILNWYNNFNGNDTQKCNQTGWSSLWNNLESYKTSKTSSYAYYPWYYYYKLIGNINGVLDKVDAAKGSAKDRAYYKAQAQTLRAYCYYRLVTMYCKRWQDSKNGASDGVVLRIHATDPDTVQDAPISTLAETYKLIYDDLDSAIVNFTNCEVDRGKNEFYKPNINVAYAVKARAALYREDWQTAADCAAKARKGYALMSVDDYKAGFNSQNSEWIWGVYEAEDQTLHYYGYYAYIGSNSSAGACRQYPVAISKELIDSIPETDARRELYLVPKTDAEFKQMNATTGRVSSSSASMYKRAKATGYLYSTSYVFGYMQFKLRAAFMPGGGSFNLFRSAEMYYTEAEADCHLGKDLEAQDLLFEVVKNYDAQYVKSTKTGEDLLEEVKLYRRFDLFGEGFDWTDCKRWKKPIDRKKLDTSKGLASPGNFHSTFAIKIDASDDSRWIWAIPNKESDYNSGLYPDKTK